MFYRTDALDSYSTTFGRGYVKNSFFGDYINVLAKWIFNQKFGPTYATRRTYDIEASSLSDTNFLYNSINVATGLTYTVVTISNASPAVVTCSGQHYFAAGLAIVFRNNGGALPTGITADKTYYVTDSPTVSTFHFSATSGGGNVNTSSAGSGEQRLFFPRPYAVGDTVLNNTVAIGSPPSWICTTAGYSLPEVGGAGGAVFRPLPNIT